MRLHNGRARDSCRRCPLRRQAMSESNVKFSRSRSAGIPLARAAGKDRDHRLQADGDPARPQPRLFARRRRAGARHRRRSRASAYDLTAKGNLVAVISNGTAILGLGNLGALASKPVMEGKAVLFKRFADVDSIDIEVATEDPPALHRIRRAARAELRRNQPRGHRRARLLHHRADAERADEHPGLPRRPARHRDHHRRGPDQRLLPDRPRARRRSAWS